MQCQIIPRVRLSKTEVMSVERKEKSQAVIFSEALLRSYFDSPLNKAAKSLGVCSTALKK